MCITCSDTSTNYLIIIICPISVVYEVLRVKTHRVELVGRENQGAIKTIAIFEASHSKHHSMKSCALKNKQHCFLRVISSLLILEERSDTSHAWGSLRNGGKNILGDPREAKKAWNLEVKPSITLVLRWTPKAEVSFISSVLLLLIQAFPMTGSIIQGWVMSKNSSFWGRQERALHHLPLASVRPALCPQITLSSVRQVSPESTISLKDHGNRKLSGLSYFCVRRKNQFLMWTQNLQPHHSSWTPEFLLFSKSNLLMPDFCFKSLCSLLIVYEINERMSPLSPFLLCTYLNFIR